MKQLSYQNDPAFKRRFVRQIDAHRRADSIVQGLYGKMNGKFRGCAVGCSIHSLDRIDGRKTDRASGYGDHSLLSKRLGIPLVLAHLEDRIFEGLSPRLAREWPGRFSRAIPVGRELSKVWPRFAVWLLTDPKHGVRQYAKADQTRDAIDGVVELYERELAGDKPTVEEWRAARQSAYASASASASAYAADAAYASAYAADAADDAAAYAAADAADAAAYAASAADAAYAADAADDAAAYAAADAADAAADAAYAADARRKWYRAAADKLVALLEAA